MKTYLKLTGITLAVVLFTACSPPSPSDAPTPTTSSIMIKLNLEELVAQSDWIVVGTVTDQKSQWNAQQSQIYTLVTLAVKEWVKGEPEGNEIIITIPGGQVGDVSQWVEDMSSFQNGEEVLVFLQSQDNEGISVVGGHQGKLVIENGKVAGSDASLAELLKQIKAQSSKSSR